MNKGPEWTFFQRRHTNDQQAQEKILNITNYQKNANQNLNEIPPHTSKKQEISVEKNMRKGNPSVFLTGI